MSCKCCASLKCFESCYKQFEMMKQSKKVLHESEKILGSINFNEITSITLLNKYISAKIPENSNQKYSNFIQLVINYVFQSRNIDDSKTIDDKSNLNEIYKDAVIEMLSILRFESMDDDFFYHYIFKNESQNNLIKEGKIIDLIKIFGIYTIEVIFSIPSFSFVHSNYLSNCEFVSFLKESISASVTNDYTSIFRSIFRYLEDINEGELTQNQFISFLNQIFSLNQNFINQKINIDSFKNVIQKIIRFVLLPTSQNRTENEDDQKTLELDDFIKIFGLSCKFINMSIKNEFFDIAYKRKDLYFSGKVNNHAVSDILDDISIIYEKLNKEKIIDQINQLEISYFDLLSIVSDEIDLSNIL